MKHIFTLLFLDSGVSLLSHLLKFSHSRRSLPLFQENHFASSDGSLYMIVVEGKDMEGVPLNLF